MAEKMKLTKEMILAKKFGGNVAGYDALEVDTFLDEIYKDFETCSKIEKEVEKLEKKIRQLQNKNLDLEALNLQLSKKNEDYKNHLSRKGTNLEYLEKIDKYERKLAALGIDPSKI